MNLPKAEAISLSMQSISLSKDVESFACCSKAFHHKAFNNLAAACASDCGLFTNECLYCVYIINVHLQFHYS